MRASALELLACPACGGDLRLEAVEAKDAHIMEGALVCCTAYPIRGGVPRFAGSSEVTATAGRFGQQWKTFAHMAPYQEEWLRAWLDPVGPDDVRGRVVYEAGCGKGRHSVVVSSWGAKALVALDLGESVDVAFAHTRELPNVHVVQGDLLRPPVRRVFDLAFSVGVLHHLPHPRAGFDAVRGVVKPGGKIAVWVYGRENNDWIVKWVDPVRLRLTARMPLEALYWATLPPSVALAGAARVWRGPYAAYMRRLATLPVREVHNIVFDQLVAPVAHYLPESEVRAWMASPGLKDATVAWHNRNSWRASATVVD